MNCPDCDRQLRESSCPCGFKRRSVSQTTFQRTWKEWTEMSPDELKIHEDSIKKAKQELNSKWGWKI